MRGLLWGMESQTYIGKYQTCIGKFKRHISASVKKGMALTVSSGIAALPISPVVGLG